MKRPGNPKQERLPAFIVPMQARPGAAFDSEDYLVEVKWDGTRALAFVEAGRVRLLNRRRADLTGRYPELGFLAGLPDGTVLDGEVVVFRGGKPDFGLLMAREQARSPLKVGLLSRSSPATYVAFDLLFHGHKSVMGLPLEERRRLLGNLVKRYGQDGLVFSEAVPGEHGRAFFAEVVRKGLEGVVAKRTGSRYVPGGRTDAWVKIKRSEVLDCVIIGFEPAGGRDFRSLFLAARRDGRLVPVGKVGTGFDAKLRDRLGALLWDSVRSRPWVSCKIKGRWVEPGLFCRVRYLETTPAGELRAPVFIELIEGS